MSINSGEDLAAAASIAEVRLRLEAQQMRQKPASSYTRGTRDITEFFIATSKQLKSGELIKDEYFTLFEAVGALEIMDPKMDSGCIPEGDSFEPEFDVCGELDASQVLWIMDEIFQLEMNLHNGYPLSQNLFTSLHIFRLISYDNEYPYHFGYDQRQSTENHLVHTVLRAYCIGVLKCCQLALQLIQDHTFYEEEDFVTYLFGRELLPKMDCKESRQLLCTAVEWLENAELDSQIKDALRIRLALRHIMIEAFEGEDEWWPSLKLEIERIRKDHSLASAVQEAFSEKVQRQLATSTPPRPMPQVQWEESVKKWLQLCDDVVAARSLTSLRTAQSPHCLQRATWAFAYRDPLPNTFARAKMQEILTSDENVAGEVSHFDLMLTDIRDMVLCGDPVADPAAFSIEVPTDVRHQTSRIIESFMSGMFTEYLNIYRMVCQNRCRMRRTFTQAIPLLDEFETAARAADEDLNNIVAPRRFLDEAGKACTHSPLAAWVRYHKLQILEWTIQLGFETDLYLPREICNMYILLEANAEARGSHLQALEQVVEARSRGLISLTSGPDSNPSAANSDILYIESCQAWIGSLRRRTMATRLLSLSLASLYAMLEHYEIIDTKAKPYEDAQLRYEARMKPFLGMVNDGAPGLDYFTQMKTQMISGLVSTGQKPSLPSTMDAITKMIKETKDQLTALKQTSPAEGKYLGTEEQWKREMKSLETVCVAITVTVSQLSRIWRNRGKSALKDLIEVNFPAPGKRYHEWWVIPPIKERAQ
ncbi:uncharacterized protein RCC_04646 [Ramularia collo-cygni]|uniref:Uncharacterized protein n=1 Tax=Ramularia collo-cygni TaxID=112498 RepID=A0A2D3UQ14_9PEZI|nr:uncharacterized protein RCC_04646 [Ramularia collo-cygni]CZT18802.1 uncharacterized protein RCC_04646 [Ramularia collo-cygni]